MESIAIKGTNKEMREITARLLEKYGKDARLIDVMMQEYGCKEVCLY